MKIEGKIAVVTGGASGLGRATVEMLISEGARVLIADIDAERGSDFSKRPGGKSVFLKGDISLVSDVKNIVNTVNEEYGGVNILVNCAGMPLRKKVMNRKGEPHSLDLFKKILDVNLTGTFQLASLAAVEMVRNAPDSNGERGVIVNTASNMAYDGLEGSSAYAASKAALVGMTLPMARDLGEYGIRVCTIAPGGFDTPMLMGGNKKFLDTLTCQIPFPSRLGRPEEFAHTVKYIIENTFLNGETIRLDGAYRPAFNFMGYDYPPHGVK